MREDRPFPDLHEPAEVSVETSGTEDRGAPTRSRFEEIFVAPPPVPAVPEVPVPQPVESSAPRATSGSAPQKLDVSAVDEENPFGLASERRRGQRAGRDAGASFEDLVAEIFPEAEQAVPELVPAEPASRTGRWLVVAGIIVIMVGGGYLLRDRVIDMVVGRPDAPALLAGDELRPVVPEPVTEGAAAVAPADATEPLHEPPLSTVATPEPPPEPEVRAPERIDPASRPAATRVLSARFERTADGGVVVLDADGGIVARRIRTLRLDNPPRQLVRISGILAQPVPETVPVGGSLLARVRMGHHPELSPPELYVVLDLAADSVRVGTPESSGDTVRISVTRGS